MTSVLEVRQVSAGYHESLVVRGVDLTVGQGEVVALLGPNGAGKTTTLRSISGTVKVKEGSISLAGRDLATLSAKIGRAHV